MKVVILCGGQGLRLKEHTAFIPKPLIEIGGRPILWHVMKIFSCYGIKEFILCLGHKGEMIKKYFRGDKSTGHDWDIEFINTGETTNTGGRIKKIEKYINEERFIATYADGLADIDITLLINYHIRKRKTSTVTAVRPVCNFGIMEIEKGGLVTGFKEKPQLDRWVNGGFFVFEKKIFDYIKEDSILERDAMEKLAAEGQLTAYKHQGFWMCMDTYKDTVELNWFWNEGGAKWKIWGDK